MTAIRHGGEGQYGANGDAQIRKGAGEIRRDEGWSPQEYVTSNKDERRTNSEVTQARPPIEGEKEWAQRKNERRIVDVEVEDRTKEEIREAIKSKGGTRELWRQQVYEAAKQNW